MELLGADANTICPMQGWLPSGTLRQGAGEGLLDPHHKEYQPLSLLFRVQVSLLGG